MAAVMLLSDHDRVDLARKVAWLSRPEVYPDPPRSVRTIETHWSWVFLTDHHAYKLKKPVHRAQLNYASLGARKRGCVEEVRLNRRLAPHVYLGVRPLLDTGADLALGPLLQSGELAPRHVVDWLVTMRRLPEELTLEQRSHLDASSVSSDLCAVGETMAAFYDRAARAGWSGNRYRRQLVRDVRRYHRELTDHRFPRLHQKLDAIATWQLRMLKVHARAFELRAGHVVDGHGDLRPEHVFLTSPPVVIDCLEFDRRLRWTDPVSELSYLGLECDRLGIPWAADALMMHYTQRTGDDVADPLRAFYEVRHASMRAVIALWHLDDPDIESPAKWVDRARAYLDMATTRVERHSFRSGSRPTSHPAPR